MFTILNSDAARALIDGDVATAFNPDEAGVEREVEVFIDLGGVFGINRVRIFPRLDSDHVGSFPSRSNWVWVSDKRALGFLRVIINQDFSQLIRYSRTRPNNRGRHRLARHTSGNGHASGALSALCTA